jgi:hypothetical protein
MMADHEKLIVDFVKEKCSNDMTVDPFRTITCHASAYEQLKVSKADIANTAIFADLQATVKTLSSTTTLLVTICVVYLVLKSIFKLYNMFNEFSAKHSDAAAAKEKVLNAKAPTKKIMKLSEAILKNKLEPTVKKETPTMDFDTMFATANLVWDNERGDYKNETHSASFNRSCTDLMKTVAIEIVKHQDLEALFKKHGGSYNAILAQHPDYLILPAILEDHQHLIFGQVLPTNLSESHEFKTLLIHLVKNGRKTLVSRLIMATRDFWRTYQNNRIDTKDLPEEVVSNLKSLCDKFKLNLIKGYSVKVDY